MKETSQGKLNQELDTKSMDTISARGNSFASETEDQLMVANIVYIQS